MRKLARMTGQNHTTIDRLGGHVGQTVTLSGWVYHSRPGGKITFIVLRDGTGMCQCIIEKNEQTAAFYEDIKRLSQESSLELTGTVKADERSAGGFELHVSGAKVAHAA